jgi:hypothetical protein
MFGTFFIERDPYRYSDIPGLLMSWTQNMGGIAAVVLVVWAILWEFGLFRKATGNAPDWMATAFRLGLLLMVLAYIPAVLSIGYDAWQGFTTWSGGASPAASVQAKAESIRRYRDMSLTAGGAVALLMISLPFLYNAVAWRMRRIWGLAKLSFKEALRRRVLYAFTGLLLIFLFSSWFISHKPEDQVRSYVQVIYLGTKIALMLAAVILASFSIPADIKQQTIHTVVTKPVERFEVLLGRFLGITAILTLVLLFATAAGLIYVVRGVDPDAAAESLKARDPLYGDLRFENTGNERGENIGKEWDYRRYITAPTHQSDLPQTAVWDYRPEDLPGASVAASKALRCEYTFDIYRTTKGTENRGVSCSFYFTTPSTKENAANEFARRLKEERTKGAKPDIEIENDVAEEVGYYQKLSQEVTDNHTQAFIIPGGIVRAALKAGAGKSDAKALQVRVMCNDKTQYVGMAKFDFYIRDDPDDGRDQARFALNFFKGNAGLWLQLVLATGVAVALSTYFSGVIAMIVTLMIYLAGYFRDFVAEVASGTNAGGGPLESLYRLSLGQNIVAPLEQTATVKAFSYTDVAYRWIIARVLDIIPDVDRFDFSSYVSEGFNITNDQLLVTALSLILYLYLWCVLAYYLMKWREIAAPT